MLYKKFFSGLGLVALMLSAFVPVAHAAEAPVDHILLSPMSASVVAGDDVRWTVIAHRTDGTTSDVTPSTILTIPENAGGTFANSVYTSQHVGVWEVSATLGTFSDTAMLYVVHDSPASLTLTVDSTIGSADEQLTFHTVLSDAQGNSWDATGQTTFSSTEKQAEFIHNVYELAQAGSFTVNATIAGLTQTLPISVTPGEPKSITLIPSGAFTLDTETIRDISATLHDADGNIITSAKPGLSITGNSASFTDDGKIKGVKAGSGTLVARYGDLFAEVPYTVNAQATPLAPVEPQGLVLGESVEAETPEVIEEETKETIAVMSEETQKEETTDSCVDTELWIASIVLIGYMLLMLGYFALIRKDEDKTWWIFPVLLTAIGIIIWTKYFCANSYIWWPWVLVLLGIFITWYGRGPMRKENSSDSDVSPGSTGDSNNQRPMF